MENATYLAGLDIGSTTVKLVVVDPETGRILFSRYQRHNAEQAAQAAELLRDAHIALDGAGFRLAVCGSGGQTIGEKLGAFFIQEVVANAIAIRELYQDVRVAVELGGQDAKVVFFRHDEDINQLIASDMRMNGSCAGGTGAFIDQVAELLHVPITDFNRLASHGKTAYDISGRCGVFAKTDIQPLLNQGVSKEDIALSTFHAIAKQTIGGLAQGMDFVPKVIFEGGPLTFNPRLIDVFKERLALGDDQIVVPENPELIVAYGAALSCNTMFGEKKCAYRQERSLQDLADYVQDRQNQRGEDDALFFKNEKEQEKWQSKNRLPEVARKQYPAGSTVDVWLGIDAGSTTSKFVLLDNDGGLVDRAYANNQGAPLDVIRELLLKMRDRYRAEGVTLNIRGCGTTGYGEELFAAALEADYHTVETVAHAEAALQYAPDASFILDIGGQDMKAIRLRDGVVTGIQLNEACSAGCGSFIETYARSLGIPVEKIAPLAFEAQHPSRLGSRCTVFMNSSIITEQKNGKQTSDILAGVCRSIIENVFTKVLRISNLQSIGKRVVVQGGTFKNDAVLRAFEQYAKLQPVRPPYPGEMGAIGIALLTKKHMAAAGEASPAPSRFIGLDAMENFSYTKEPGVICRLCTNNCNRTVIHFNNGKKHVTGNRCERGAVLGDLADPAVREEVKALDRKIASVPDMMQLQEELLFHDYAPQLVDGKKNISIGLPRALDFFKSMPFWRALFTSLGFDVVLSDRSTYPIFDSGLQSVPSDTICFPAKLAHGHIKNLIEKGVDRIFMPMQARMPLENKSAKQSYMCVVVMGYPLVIQHSDEPHLKHNVFFDNPLFHWSHVKVRNTQLRQYFKETHNISDRIIDRAIGEADKAALEYQRRLHEAGQRVIDGLKGTRDFAVILAGRPYHTDMLVNHTLSRHFTAHGIPVLTLDSLPGLHKEDLSGTRMESIVPYHSRMLGAALQAARNPHLELVQIVSFGCGHDAIISDEIQRLLHQESDKELLILKLDEGENAGPLSVRVKSFIETVRTRRESHGYLYEFRDIKLRLQDAYQAKFRKGDKKKRTILIPNLSPGFSRLLTRVVNRSGYRTVEVPIADARAIEIGKKYVHNDMCFPAQVNMGELIKELQDGNYDQATTAIALAKNCEECRAGQYSVVGRKALDDAGWGGIPIVTTGIDTKNMHPGFKLYKTFQLRMLYGIVMLDHLEYMVRRIRPYEVQAGDADRVYDMYLDLITRDVPSSRRKAIAHFEKAIEAFNHIPISDEPRRPVVGIVGEILLNFHPASNCYLEKYLEDNGMETQLPTLIDFFRRRTIADKIKGEREWSPFPLASRLLHGTRDKVYGHASDLMHRKMEKFRFYQGYSNTYSLIKNVEDIVDATYIGGEGWLIPGEIIQMIHHGVESFVIVQPFACLPNHITGRGLIKAMKKRYPHINIVALDYDPDTAIANVENRLQMLIISARERRQALAADKAAAPVN